MSEGSYRNTVGVMTQVNNRDNPPRLLLRVIEFGNTADLKIRADAAEQCGTLPNERIDCLAVSLNGPLLIAVVHVSSARGRPQTRPSVLFHKAKETTKGRTDMVNKRKRKEKAENHIMDEEKAEVIHSDSNKNHRWSREDIELWKRSIKNTVATPIFESDQDGTTSLMMLASGALRESVRFPSYKHTNTRVCMGYYRYKQGNWTEREAAVSATPRESERGVGVAQLHMSTSVWSW
ncbi:hypothetical protein JOB18_045198 [Solea senegalensis]|uniref:Uncharacterized protein n=1 Tax=Solea senegalensis TaxID=28829 RepID=A0AAV6RKC5_SOLSE|nr:hypothetical protein JOB18_045198 [Solea senegalensis]